MAQVTIYLNPRLLSLQPGDNYTESLDRYRHWLAAAMAHHWPDLGFTLVYNRSDFGLVIARQGEAPGLTSILRVMDEVETEDPWRIPIRKEVTHG